MDLNSRIFEYRIVPEMLLNNPFFFQPHFLSYQRKFPAPPVFRPPFYRFNLTLTAEHSTLFIPLFSLRFCSVRQHTGKV